MYRSLLEVFLGTRRRAWATILAWLLLVGVLASLAPSIDEVKAAGGDGAPADSRSVQAEERLRAEFPGTEDLLPGIITITTDDADATRRATEAVVAYLSDTISDRTLAPITSLCTDPAAGRCLPTGEEGTVSADGTTRTIIVPVVGDPTTPEFRADVDALRTGIAASAPEARTHLTGPAGIITDTVKVFASGDRVLLLGTILLVLLILIAVYRSPVMAVLPLLAVGVAMRLAEIIGALLADADLITIDAQTASIMTVLLFGVGTDYALIINARYREALAHEPDRHRAMITAMHRTGEVLASSAGTIILAMMALLFTSSPALRGFGPYLAIGVGSMALVAATLLPALFLVSGRAAFWPAGQDRAVRRVDSRLWRRIADTVDGRPKAVLASSLVLLLILSAGLLGYKESFNFLTGFRVDTDSAAGQQVIAEDLGAGEIAPVTLLIEGRDLTADTLKSAAAELPGLDPGNISRAVLSPRDINEDGTAARMSVILAHDPYEPPAMDALPSIEAAAAQAIGGEVEVTATGESATNADIRDALASDMRLLIPLMLLIVGVVLAVLLRSLLAPVYLVATLALSFLATLGLTVLIAVTLQGDSGIGNRVTAYILVFLIALGVDYTIFLMSRVKQELRFHDMREALRTSLVRTGGVVSSAGLILAATFAVLMTQPIRELYQFGLAMALGILLDTFIVRPLLVPAIVRLIGDRALWPVKPGA